MANVLSKTAGELKAASSKAHKPEEQVCLKRPLYVSTFQLRVVVARCDDANAGFAR